LRPIQDIIEELTYDVNELKDEVQYYKTKSSNLEEGYMKLQRENEELKKDRDHWKKMYNDLDRFVEKEYEKDGFKVCERR